MPAGRPREFDVEQGLDAAMRVFWRQGYEGTAISDLTEALGINRPSLYAAYGNKAELFQRALAHYATRYAPHTETSLAEPSARGVVEGFWRGAVAATTNESCPQGCFAVQTALVAGPETEQVRDVLAGYRKLGEETLRARLARAQAEGDLPASVDPAVLARYVVAVGQGMSVHAAGGASRAELDEVVDLALAAWDSLTASSGTR
ncbi:AcrR family transcriptional regulator [Crossiella equi]|uniref:AcrR family transcriptional regulator n=1 Tax=Crossiella equi TaxID=130796 RepID=A0ABS5A916_9PSEU|nr:TetR/AcrR family transcriptional regulator [Crossiella equi]MBP2473084.1 AcrR family transcriptional regulator [Crossiella equi]